MRTSASCPTSLSKWRCCPTAARGAAPEGRADLACAPRIVGVQIGRGRGNGCMAQVVAHGNQFDAVLQRVGRVGMAHPVGTGAPQPGGERGIVVLKARGGLHKKTLQHLAQPRRGDAGLSACGEITGASERRD